jgi:hypothetical protein
MGDDDARVASISSGSRIELSRLELELKIQLPLEAERPQSLSSQRQQRHVGLLRRLAPTFSSSSDHTPSASMVFVLL